MSHDKFSFTREYCRCRKIPYRITGESLLIKGYFICFSLLNLSYTDIINVIDTSVNYDNFGNFMCLKL